MSAPHLLVDLSDGVLTLTMNRPDARNALSLEMSALLLESLRQAQTNPAVRAVVLTGAGGAFCAGGDVKAMAAGRDAAMSFEERVASLRDRADASRLLHEMAKPTVAVIPGAAAGAGLGMAMACDFRLAVSNARFTVAFAKVGLCGDYGASYFLTQLVGPAKAKELLMLSPVLDAAEAAAIGLVTRVHEPDAFADQARAFVRGLAEGPSVALGYIKQNVNLAAHADLRASIDSEATHQVRCMVTADHAEAAAAFVEKRAPKFSGA
ncbi:MAG: enoyl-CoA hydratase/isomerase family protein [Burkholderiaceae bacterium]|nr:enoyl-CoA hydratase/isomerase family protein [Burkholderiaceae bacterium]